MTSAAHREWFLLRMNIRLLMGRRAVVLMVADGLLIFLAVVLCLTAPDPGAISLIGLIPGLAVGVPALSGMQDVDRRASMAELIPTLGSPVAFYGRRLTAWWSVFAAQSTVLLLWAHLYAVTIPLLWAVAHSALGLALFGIVAVLTSAVTPEPSAIMGTSLVLAIVSLPLLLHRPGWQTVCVLAAATLVSGATLIRKLHHGAVVPVHRRPELHERAIRLLGLTVTYGRRVAVDDVTLDAPIGVTALLGPNGAGKTTLLQCVAGLRRPSKGTVTIDGDGSPGAALVPQDAAAYGDLTVDESLLYWVLSCGGQSMATARAAVRDSLAADDLLDLAHRRGSDLSGGQRRRVALAIVRLWTPAAVLLDEPTVGADLASRERIRALTRDLARRSPIILSSHIASDVDAVAELFVILVQGRVEFAGSKEALLSRAAGRVYEAVVTQVEARALLLREPVTQVVSREDGTFVRAISATPLASRLLPTVEEAFLAIAAQAQTFDLSREGEIATLWHPASIRA